MILKINISDLDRNKKWWDNLSVQERRDFLVEKRWLDTDWSNYNWSDLHTGLRIFIDKNR